jgi:tetratricopeptide (TPR) repeat protein
MALLCVSSVQLPLDMQESISMSKLRKQVFACLSLATLFAAALAIAPDSGGQTTQRSASQQSADTAAAGAPLFEGLGKYRRRVTTSSPEAQRYFDQGLAFLQAFNHDEAIRSFTAAGTLDPNCAMAWWGVAFANGPHINNPVVPEERAKAAWEALGKAQRAAAKASAVERALIAALGRRYANPQPDDRKPLDLSFAEAMRKVWQQFPSDPDVGAFFAESMMDLRPWDLWTAGGHAHPGTGEIVAAIEKVLTLSPNHPLALHLYIHAVEASPNPGRAADEADRLRDLMPGLGHMVHMPSHIDVRLGKWAVAAVANDKAIAADKTYRETSPDQGFYRVYMAHNQHMLSFAAMMQGQSKRSIDAINAMASGIPAEWIKQNAAIADGFTAMPLEVLVRFGKWEEVLAAPEPAEYLPIARGLWHCARGIAYAAKGDIASAKLEQEKFAKAAALISEEAFFSNNKGRDLMHVAQHLLAGEILYRDGKTDQALAELRQAVAAEDLLRYAEPPDWLIPTRHALGATLLHAGRTAEAEKVYRADLQKLPENGWSLYGLAKSLAQQGKSPAAVQKRFEQAWQNADIKISSSCLCLPGK